VDTLGSLSVVVEAKQDVGYKTHETAARETLDGDATGLLGTSLPLS
jgi:hypothetical protein